MKQYFLRILLLPCCVCLCTNNAKAQSQSSRVISITENILKALEGSDAIRNLYINRNHIDNQLRDINNWAGDINTDDYSKLKVSYEETRSHLAAFTKHLCDDLKAFKRIKDLKGEKLQQFGNRALNVYQADLSAANTAYTAKFKPLYEQVAADRGKAPKIPFAAFLPIIIEATPVLVNLVSNLIQGNSQGAADNTFQLAITGVTTTLESKLRLASWESRVINTPGRTTTSTQAQTIAINTSADINARRNYNSVDATVALTTVNNGSMNLKVNSVNVSGKQINWFETVDNLPEGFTYQVDLSGYSYANVLAYSHTKGMWEWLEPKPTKDIETVTIDLNGGTKKLPAFRIKNSNNGGNREEHFLVLLSNQPIDGSRVNSTLTSQSGTAVLNMVNGAFGAQTIQSPTVGLMDGQTTSALSLYQVTDGSAVVLPVYIKLNRQ